RVLPFKPTDAQKRALGEIAADLERSVPMNRLLQGDVGSGKTIVALEAATVVIENGYQAALMAPTEILAGQHYLAARKIFARAGYKVELLVSGLKAAEKRETLERVKSGAAQLVVGTHALLEPQVEFARLGLVIEQSKTAESQRSLKAAIVEYERLKQFVFPEKKVGLLHGRMKSEEKEDVMERFRRREIDLLVATTVIEVGVDVPNATVMVIEHADRFGLSQLHQLRGRIGRG